MADVLLQIFAIQLLSHLCTQYALPKSLSVARLAISVMGTLLTGDASVSLKLAMCCPLVVHLCNCIPASNFTPIASSTEERL